MEQWVRTIRSSYELQLIMMECMNPIDFCKFMAAMKCDISHAMIERKINLFNLIFKNDNVMSDIVGDIPMGFSLVCYDLDELMSLFSGAIVEELRIEMYLIFPHDRFVIGEMPSNQWMIDMVCEMYLSMYEYVTVTLCTEIYGCMDAIGPMNGIIKLYVFDESELRYMRAPLHSLESHKPCPISKSAKRYDTIDGYMKSIKENTPVDGEGTQIPQSDNDIWGPIYRYEPPMRQYDINRRLEICQLRRVMFDY